jgi:hypothetical protein
MYFGFIGVTNLDYIYYKKLRRDTAIKILGKDIRSFVVKSDSFTVSKSSLITKCPFLQVRLNGANKLYLSKPMALTYNPGTNFGAIGGAISALASYKKYQGYSYGYYYGPNQDELSKLDKKNFIDVMSIIMADKPEIVTKIKDKTYRFGNVESLIDYYTTGVEPLNTRNDDDL